VGNETARSANSAVGYMYTKAQPRSTVLRMSSTARSAQTCRSGWLVTDKAPELSSM